MKKIIFCFLLIMLSYIALGITTYNYSYYNRVLPGDYVNKSIGNQYDYTITDITYGDTHATATCTGPNESSLPDSLIVDAEPDPDPNIPGTIVYIRGNIVPADPADNDKISTSTSTYRSENYILGTQEYVFDDIRRYQVDDYGDAPQSVQIGTLPVLENLNNDGWLNCYLFAKETWNGKNIPTDIDVFEVITLAKTELDPGVYCIETLLDDTAPETPLEITVYEANAAGDDYDVQIGLGNAFNCYDDLGEIDNQHQRVYFTKETAGKVYIKINSTDPDFQGEYKIRVLKAKPIVLVHGMIGYPISESDTRSDIGDFSYIAPWDTQMYPCKVYDFPWSSGSLDDNVTENLLKTKFKNYVENKKDIHNCSPVLIGYSMGTLICRAYVYNNQNDFEKMVLIAGPMYGSDLANLWLIQSLTSSQILVRDLLSNLGYKESENWGTVTEDNLRAVERGGQHAYNMHLWQNRIDARVLCCAGTDNTGYRRTPLFLEWLGRKTGLYYTTGLLHSDSVVPVSSANLRNINSAVNLIYFDKDHREMGSFDINVDPDKPPEKAEDVLRNTLYKDVREFITEGD